MGYIALTKIGIGRAINVELYLSLSIHTKIQRRMAAKSVEDLYPA